MLGIITDNNNIYFLLDKMFKYTNSDDRYKGGYLLIKQLCQLGTSGIIATHDIELAKLASDNGLVDNYSFNSEIIGEKMIFSYKLIPQICNDFNTIELMRRSGIEVITDIDDTKN